MSGQILIAYATRAGSTAEVAREIGKVLGEHGEDVDVRPVKDVRSVDGYRAMVIGSAVRMGAWLPEAVKFVEKNRELLGLMPMAIFAVHLMNLGDDETSRNNRQAYLEPVRKLVHPTSEALFAGVGDWEKVSLLDRMISKAVKAPVGDFRDWTAIHTWAEHLHQNGFDGSGA